MTRRTLERLVVLILVAVIMLFAVLESREFPKLARLFPQTTAAFGLALALLSIGRLLLAQKLGTQEATDPDGSFTLQLRSGMPYLFWLAGYYLGIFLFGFIAASAIFAVLFTILVGRMRVLHSLVATGLLMALILLFGKSIGLHWPQGVLEGWVLETWMGR
jgi:hypothetical protein